MAAQLTLILRHAELVSASIAPEAVCVGSKSGGAVALFPLGAAGAEKWILKQVQDDG
jgi:hypothetical protein